MLRNRRLRQQGLCYSKPLRCSDEHKFKIDSGLFNRPQEIRTPHKVIQTSHSQLSHPFSGIFSNQSQVMNKHLWRTCKLRSQVLALRCNTSRTGIQVTLSSHITAQSYQAGSAEAKFLGTQHGSNHYVAPRFQTTINT